MVKSAGFELTDTGDLVSTPLSGAADALAKDGYALVRGLLPRERVQAAGHRIYRKLADRALLDPARPVEEGVAAASANCAFLPELANGDPVIESLLYEGELPAAFETIFGEEVLHYDFTWLRAVAPGRGTHPHMDFVYMGRGTDRVLTAWVPLIDVDWQTGGLLILENSHRIHELTEGYARIDVDAQCESGGPSPIERAGYLGSGAITDDPSDLQRRFGGRWLSSDFRAGDVLFFTMFLAHGSLDNQSDRIRLSLDCRFQPKSQAADARWIGPSPQGHRWKTETIC